MKCQSKISPYCKKTIKKDKSASIWYKGKRLLVCRNCFWKIKRINKGLEKPVGRKKKEDIKSKLNACSKPFRAMLKAKKE